MTESNGRMIPPEVLTTPTGAPASSLPQVRYSALLDRGEGVLYESDAIQIGLKTEFRRVGRAQGDVALF